MPGLDRRITVQRRVTETDDFGRPLPTVIETIASVWAQRHSAGTVDTLLAGGVLVTESVSWTIRYREDVIAADLGALQITDSSGVVWNPETMIESDARRRYIDISAVREVSPA